MLGVSFLSLSLPCPHVFPGSCVSLIGSPFIKPPLSELLFNPAAFSSRVFDPLETVERFRDTGKIAAE